MSFTARATSYEEVPYADDPYPSSHPGHLAAVATLAGLSPAPVERCRVLELGCARGGNLIPMALALPGSRFVGIDSSPGQVAAARQVIDALGLENIAVEPRDIQHLDDSYGMFDYIICHGTYSWVPAHVQDGILEICARDLAPGGIAYISYNTYPGWRLRGLVRDLMCYHTRRCDRAEDRAERARRVLGFMASAAAPFDRTYATWLGEESEYLRSRPDSYLLHDHLEEVNDPVYFHQFADRAAAKGLRYVSEVQTSAPALESFPPGVVDGLRRLAADDLEFEQSLDFLINRKFRQSVFCRSAMNPRRAPGLAEVSRLRFVTPRPGSIPPVPFRDERLIRAALGVLAARAPRDLAWGSLFALATRGESPNAQEDLASDLICCYNHKVVEFRTDSQSFVLEISEKPFASPLARFQAGLGTTVTNLRHESGRLSEFSRFVVRLLDGSRDRPAILRALGESRNEGSLVIPGTAREVGAGDPTREGRHEAIVGPLLDRCLERLARFALLMR